MTRGLRNNNPGNIRLSATQWAGEVRPSRDNAFCIFRSMAYGYRALIRTLQTYARKHACRTIPDFIKRWAPSSENDTASYIKSVCAQMKVTPTQVINVDDKATMCALASAISKHENGVPANMAEVESGWQLL